LAATLTACGLLALVLLGASAVNPSLTTIGRGSQAYAAPGAKGPRLSLHIDDMSPRVITADGPGTLTVTASLTNIGDTDATGVKVRPQRGDRLRTEGELRTALSGDDAADTELGAFTDLADTLAAGTTIPVRLSVPLRGPPNKTLALEKVGVYPLLINVNGDDADGQRTRLTAVRMLLPVLGLPATGIPGMPPVPANPPAPPNAPGPGDAAGDGALVAPPPADPTGSNPVTVLYPLADEPHRLPTGPSDAVVIGSDDQGGDPLAAELNDGGRLDGLLDALEGAAPQGSAVGAALCLAVDPDLVRTVYDMAGGYQLRTPEGVQTEGTGADAAAKWLTRLRADAAGRCVIALPFADADLVALSRAGLNDLATYATKAGARIVGQLLGTAVRTDVTWPADGLMDERSLTDLMTAGGRVTVLSSDAVSQSGRSGSRDAAGGVVRLNAPHGRGNVPIGILADPLFALAAGETAASGAGTDQVGASGGRGLGSLSLNASTSLAGTGAPLSGEDLTGAVVFRALDPAAEGLPLLVAPPHRWNTTGADARGLLDAVSRLIAGGQFRSTPLIGGPGTGDPVNSATYASLVYPLRAGAREVPTTVTSKLKVARDGANELRSASYAEPGVGVTPAQVFDPVTEGLLRAASAVSRGRESDSVAAAKVISDRVRLLRSSVRVLEPPSPFALGDRAAPLPITLANGLPVGMNVQVALSRTPGLRTDAIPAQRIPPLGRLQLRVNAQLSRSGQFSVEARLTTLAGAQLGPVSRLQIRSTAYGTITLWLTGTAGALLVILSARRITRRIRASRSRPRGPGLPMSEGTGPLGRLRPGDELLPAVERTLGPMPLEDLPPLDPMDPAEGPYPARTHARRGQPPISPPENSPAPGTRGTRPSGTQGSRPPGPWTPDRRTTKPPPPSSRQGPSQQPNSQRPAPSQQPSSLPPNSRPSDVPSRYSPPPSQRPPSQQGPSGELPPLPPHPLQQAPTQRLPQPPSSPPPPPAQRPDPPSERPQPPSEPGRRPSGTSGTSGTRGR
jgi:hypothetical protein